MTFVNILFSGNQSCWTAGAVLSNSSDTVFTNCTFNGNRYRLKPGGAFSLYKGRASLINCILWGDLSQDSSEIWADSGEMTVKYTIVEGGFEGIWNLDTKPDFVQEGFWDETDNWVDGNYRLSRDSMGIDTGTSEGTPNFDLEGIMRPQQLAHDRGVYEHDE